MAARDTVDAMTDALNPPIDATPPDATAQEADANVHYKPRRVERANGRGRIYLVPAGRHRRGIRRLQQLQRRLQPGRRWNAVAWLGVTTEVVLGLLIVALLALQRYSSTVVANPDNRVLVGALAGSLAESLTLWLAAIAVVVLMITLPAVFLARRST